MNRYGEPSTSRNGVSSDTDRNGTFRAKTDTSRNEDDERFRNLVESSLQGVVVHRNDRLLFANQAAADILGCDSPEDILRMNTIDECVAPHLRERMKTYREARARGEEAPEHYEFQDLRKGGTTS